VRRSSRPAQTQNPIAAARRALNAPRRALRRAERQLVLPLVIVVGVIALIGSLSGPNGSSPTASRTTPTAVDVARPSYVYVTGSRVNQRRGPSTSHAVLGSLADGARVEALSRDGQWTQVRSNLGDGCMASRFLSSLRPATAPEIPPQASIRASAVRIIDGDTIEYGGLSIRLVGFDTPETHYADCADEKARGDAATAHLGQLIRGSGTLQLFLLDERDRYGRGLGSLLVDGRDVGDVLISKGLARRYNGGQRRGWC
jgi:endonuclease YncB( thermonuclease family)